MRASAYARCMAEFCPHGCYWDCEHRRPPERGGLDWPAQRSEDTAALWPVEPVDGGSLRWCAECRSPFYEAVAHAREHQRMRQLGWLR